jgi:hypothetical protein
MRYAVCVLVLLASACGGSKGGTPTGPTPSTQTRIIRLEAGLDFGEMPVGSRSERILRIYNEGNSPMTVTGLTGPSGYVASWTDGTIAAGTSQASTIVFQPTENRSYNGTLTVQANHTSGTNTTLISGRGLRDPFRRSGVGDTVFDMPTDVQRVRIIGVFTGGGSNFIVRIAGRLIVNEIIGTRWPSTRHEGIYLTSGGVVEIVSSSGVQWSFEEVR